MKALNKMKALFHKKGYRINELPYQLNIVGVRSPYTTPNRFDDEIHVFFNTDDKGWVYRIFKATTDPGTYWLNNPMSPQGTAILQEGQYIDTYALGMHRGKYLALVQQLNEVIVLRDYNRDAVLDFSTAKPQKGWFGINIHRALVTGKTKSIDRHSAGCQVFEDAADFEAFIKLCMEHRNRHGNKFTYTLIDLRELTRAAKKQVFKYSLIGGGVAALSVGAVFGIKFLLKRYATKPKKR